MTPATGFKRCGGCEGCAKFREGPSKDCGECPHCLDMPKFGGRKGRSSLRTCVVRMCKSHPDLLKRAHDFVGLGKDVRGDRQRKPEQVDPKTQKAHAKAGTELLVETRGKSTPAVTAKMPFVTCHYHRPAA